MALGSPETCVDAKGILSLVGAQSTSCVRFLKIICGFGNWFIMSSNVLFYFAFGLPSVFEGGCSMWPTNNPYFFKIHFSRFAQINPLGSLVWFSISSVWIGDFSCCCCCCVLWGWYLVIFGFKRLKYLRSFNYKSLFREKYEYFWCNFWKIRVLSGYW